MHVVILCDHLPPDSPGGAGFIAWQLGQGLIEAGKRVTFITSTPGPSRVETRQGIQVHLLHSRYAARWTAWFGLLNPQTVMPLNILLRKLRPDVAHAHTVHAQLGYHSLVIARYSGAATVFTAHDVMPFAYAKLTHFIDPARTDQTGGWDYRLPFGYNVRQMRLRWNPARNLSIRHTMRYYVDARVAVSHALKEALEANRLSPFQVMHNGLDLSRFDVPEAGVEVLRQRWRLEGRRVILFGGRLSREKGADQLLQALRRVRERVPNVSLLVLARSVTAIERALAEHPDLEPNIVLGGWLEGAELASAYRLADVVATPSVYHDPFPTMNLEGMAAGAVPVTTCFGGSSEAVIDGETGFVVNPYDLDAFSDRLIRLLSDEALHRRMAEAGQKRMAEQFTLKQQTDATVALYEQVIDRRQREH